MRKTTVVLIVLMTFLLTYLGCNVQRNMLYYPSSHVPSEASLAAYNMSFWPSGPNDYRGFINTIQSDHVKGTIIVFHGNAGTAADREYYIQFLTHLGFRVILAEYPGYGGRKGELGEESFVRDGKETLRLASEKYGGPIFLLGESLGCGVVAAVAKGSAVKIDGIILITPWDTLLSVAKEKFFWFPVRLLMQDKYDTISNLKEFKGRVAVIGAERDDIVPIHHAQELFGSLPGLPKMYTVKSAGHNDWLDFVDQAWWKEIMDFIQGSRA
jgi:uncharacterized protein